MNSLRKNKWITSIELTLLISFVYEVSKISFLRPEYSTIYEIPTTLHTLWEVSAIVIVFVYVKRKWGFEYTEFFIMTLIGLIITGIFLTMIPYDFELIKLRYYASEYHYPDDSIVDKGMIYSRANDLSIIYDILNKEKLANSVDGGVNAVGFITWQYGMAKGFMPNETSTGYNGCDNLFERFILFFTVGPIALFEAFILGIVKNFGILLFMEIIYYFIFKEVFWLHGRPIATIETWEEKGKII